MDHPKRPISPRAAAREARAHWDKVADVWEDFVESGKDWSRYRVHGRALLRNLGPVRGLRVLDLGCGQGYFCREVARRGGLVTGIDWSNEMLLRARREEDRHPRGITYRRADAAHAGRLWPEGSFDRVVACMSFMDMPNPAAAIRGASRLLHSGGRLVFSISHPVNTAPKVRWERPGAADRGAWMLDGYFVRGPHRLHWGMTRLKRPFWAVHWHHTLEDWFEMVRAAGFEVTRLTEPHPTPEDIRAHPGLAGSGKIPFWLVWDCRKP